ncbi:MAG: mechanosensitive ion channel family protein, partial [Gemmatimonadota bacterium]|nr:mechanosensitive ion channel family protein [Gemmatimonadota bacterium]
MPAAPARAAFANPYHPTLIADMTMDFLDRQFLDNALRTWAVALALGLGTAIALRIFARVLVRRLGTLAEKTATFWDDVLAGMLAATHTLFLLIVAAFVATLVLTLPTSWEILVGRGMAVALIVQTGLWAAAALTGWLANYRRQKMEDDPAAATTVSAIGFVGKLVLWSVVLLVTLQNLGVDVTALVAGLGVGGIAVALAAQNILGDLFASLSIVLDKPFVLGDFVVVGDFAGSIEFVGLKTTRIRSLSGEQLVFSNADLLQSRLRNFGRMRERRILFTVGVIYQTSRQQLDRIPVILREAVESVDQARFDRAHFKSFGPSSLDFEVVYYVQVPDYNAY